jgi:hypothetical protein
VDQISDDDAECADDEGGKSAAQDVALARTSVECGPKTRGNDRHRRWLMVSVERRASGRIVHAAGSGCATPFPDDLVMALS